MWYLKYVFLPLSTLVIDNPRRGDRITRKQIDELRNFMKLLDSRSSESLLIAAAFRSISDERHDDVEEFWESRRSFLMQMQLRNILILKLIACSFWISTLITFHKFQLNFPTIFELQIFH